MALSTLDSAPTTDASSFTRKLEAAKAASVPLATATTAQKNDALEQIAHALETNQDRIILANAEDLDRGRESGMSQGLLDRLVLDERRIAGLAQAVRDIIALPDPVGDSVRGSRLPNGVVIQQVRVPFGVVGAIYEARPNVTVDIAALAL